MPPCRYKIGPYHHIKLVYDFIYNKDCTANRTDEAKKVIERRGENLGETKSEDLSDSRTLWLQLPYVMGVTNGSINFVNNLYIPLK